ncbi:MAG: DUF99 family protein [Methanothrix sp.]|uniref:endonuclease dU n=1 Tax=Methanothrix sp. TaxID=90426 RepID=UPI0025E59F24|nr:DUF99 family protein [Methanothrix sp.]MCQ8903208.1 DUF99 family protein [Methanothrix sp.]
MSCFHVEKAIRVNKPGIRALGIAESFVRSDPVSTLAGIVMRGDLRIDGVALAEITVGGMDATGGVLSIYRKLNRDDINILMLSGNVISWFNIIDPEMVHRETGLPVISVTYEESDGLEKYIEEYFPGDAERLRRYRALGERSALRLKTGYDLFVRAHGISLKEARAVLNRFTLEGRIPEPVRVARLIARAAMRIGRESGE